MIEELQAIALKWPDIEALVFWHDQGEWTDASGEVLESDEAAFYAEGLLEEGFGIAWQLLGQNGPAIPGIPAGYDLMQAMQS